MCQTVVYKDGDSIAKIVGESIRAIGTMTTAMLDASDEAHAPPNTIGVLSLPRAKCGPTPVLHAVTEKHNPHGFPIPDWAKPCRILYVIEVNAQNIYEGFATSIASGRLDPDVPLPSLTYAAA